MPGTAEITIRAGTETDIDGASQVLRAAYEQFKEPMLDRFDIYIADVVDVRSRWETSDLLVATSGERIIGCVHYYPDASRAEYPADAIPFPSEWAAIRLLAVDPGHRARGVGRLLTQACLERAQAQAIPTIGLHTTRFMDLAQAMYERMGFQRIPAYDFHPTPRIAVLAYRLDLDPSQNAA